MRGPAVIGAGARLTDCYMGPYTAIGERCAISSCRGRALDPAGRLVVSDLDGRMESSLLGRNVTIRRGQRQPRAYRFMVGDNSDIAILREGPAHRRQRACWATMWCARLSDAGHESVSADRAELDIADEDAVDALLDRAHGGVDARTSVINCAAWTDVDGAETAEERRRAVNGTGPGTRPRPARRGGCRSSYVSTDYVFDGAEGRALRRVRPDRAAVGLRADQAGRRGRCSAAAAPHRRPHRLALRDRRRQLRRRRCCGWPKSATRSRWSPTRSARRRGPGTSHQRSSGCSNGRSAGSVHMAGAGVVLLERVREGDLPTGRGRLHGASRRPASRWPEPPRGRPGRRWSPSAGTWSRCPTGVTGWRAIWQRGLG